ncbi:cell division protein SepF [Aeromicrobium sp. PE09-221]|uniref:cell division protein SepF n=1 Tax=Aeromicrobium sp. PE09-221 TaxID=1898043 RepID=UPI000B3EB7DA|nr:cell division protein SepF [Aeromicrobium sp. PE09-221]
MAGAMRKVGEYLGLVEQADYDDVDVEESGPVRNAPVRTSRAQAPRAQAPRAQAAEPEQQTFRPQVRPVADLDERRAASFVGPTDLSRIETVTPHTYNDARTVGEHFRSGVPVIMNLSDISDEDAKRLVDFAAGLVFASHGSLNRITAKVFLLSPESIVVSEEDKQAIVAGGFYNQS